MSNEQQAFIDDQFFSLTLMATVQRGKVYREDSNEVSRDAFRRALRSRLEDFVKRYKAEVSEDQHLANIENLANELSTAHTEALNRGRFRIGSAQKALNLYLKYMWCVGRISTPPHCPFDYTVLSQLPGCRNIKWTQLDSLIDYKGLVQKARMAAGDVSIAEWELQLFNTAHP